MAAAFVILLSEGAGPDGRPTRLEIRPYADGWMGSSFGDGRCADRHPHVPHRHHSGVAEELGPSHCGPSRRPAARPWVVIEPGLSNVLATAARCRRLSSPHDAAISATTVLASRLGALTEYRRVRSLESDVRSQAAAWRRVAREAGRTPQRRSGRGAGTRRALRPRSRTATNGSAPTPAAACVAAGCDRRVPERRAR